MAKRARETPSPADVAAVRQFNRFFTRQLGIIEPRHLNTDFSLPEARVIYELAQTSPLTPSQLVALLGMDAGQLSRLLQGLQRREIISRRTAAQDKRQVDIGLTAKGRRAFTELDRRSNDHVGRHLASLTPVARTELIGAMQRIARAFGTGEAPRSAITLRTHRPGDIGWIIARHGDQYAEEFGWDIGFEQMVAEIAAQFLKHHDSERERCWIAEVDGTRAGTVTLVKGSEREAKLRLLIVEPWARGLGLGRRLTDECIRFAREAGYTAITLWTQSILVAARAIYHDAGFRLAKQEPHRSFGHDLIGETWELRL